MAPPPPAPPTGGAPTPPVQPPGYTPPAPKPPRNPWKIGAIAGAAAIVAAGGTVGGLAASGAFSGSSPATGTSQSQTTTPGTTTPTTPTTPVIPETPAAGGAAAVATVAHPQPAQLPESEQDIVTEMMGSTAADGTTVTAVKVIQKPVVLTNGLEIAEVNESFSDGTTYHMHLAYNPSTNQGHMHTQYRISSIDSAQGLQDEFTETSLPDAVTAGSAAMHQATITYHSSFHGQALAGAVLVTR